MRLFIRFLLSYCVITHIQFHIANHVQLTVGHFSMQFE